MYYIKINGKIKPQQFNLVSDAKAEIERLRSETTVDSWNILTEESAAYERGISPHKFKVSTVEKYIIIGILFMIALGIFALLYRRYNVNEPTHFVASEMINYRSEKGEILGQLEKGAGIVCRRISKRRCLTTIDGKDAYIYLNVLQKK